MSYKKDDHRNGYQQRCDGARPKRRVEMILIFIIIAIVAMGFLNGCGGREQRPPDPMPASSSVPSPPSREDIIQAVRRSVEGKTYTVTTQRQQPKQHICSQYDVDRDPYMPRNPELAKCPYVGATYRTVEIVSERQTQTCKTLPGPEQGWQVAEVARDRWRVSRSGSVWDVEKQDSSSSSAGQRVTVSSFVFAIKPHQDC